MADPALADLAFILLHSSLHHAITLRHHPPPASSASSASASSASASPPLPSPHLALSTRPSAGRNASPGECSSPESSPERHKVARSIAIKQARAAAEAERKPGGGGRAAEQEWSADGWGEGEEDADEIAAAHAVAMHASIVANRADMIETLLVGAGSDNGKGDPNCALKGGKRPLCLAAQMGLYDISAALLSHGADPTAADDNGDSALHLAAAKGHVALARLLLDAGALPSALNSSGRTALHLAGTTQMQTLLRAADAGDALPPRLEGEEEEDDEGEEEDDEEGAMAGGVSIGAGAIGAGTGKEGKAGKEGVLSDANGTAVNGAGKGARGGAAKAAQPSAAATSSAPVPFGPPPVPVQAGGDVTCSPERLGAYDLIRELQLLLNAPDETDLKRLLVIPHGLQHEVQCDVVRVGKGNSYRCYLRLGGGNDRRVCVFEATRTRKGKLKNSQYRIMLPSHDARMIPPEYGPVKEMSDEALDAALYCGKVRSYNLSGANFVAYDDGIKEEAMPKGPAADQVRARKQLVAMMFNKSTSRRVPMTMRMLLPTPTPNGQPDNPTAAASDLLESLQAVPLEVGQDVPPTGTQMLKLVPPRWNADEQMFQLFCEGRACCMSNKNVQLADTSRPDEAALQVGKLRANMFNVDMMGCVSPFQAFASALAVFDQSSVRRRF